MYLLGLDIGSSSIKAALVDARSGRVAGLAQSPDIEMPILAPQPGWAEQDPEQWWEHCRIAVRKLLQTTAVNPADLAAIGIAYQMHGLVLIDQAGKPVRPAIIWCDSRAVETGEAAWRDLGADFCLQHLLNAPGNFTASKWKWVQVHEPELCAKAQYAFLPGDYIAYRLSGEALTTVSGLSEGMLWDFKENKVAEPLLDYFGLAPSHLPPLAPTFGLQGRVTGSAAADLGLKPGIPISYRAGDQPNNALSLNVLEPGEVAATGGTSGVVYGVIDRLASDRQGRVNSFAHVNHQAEQPRIGILLCINGAGILYGWLRKNAAGPATPYEELERLASTAPAGAAGLRVLPFGNGAERMLGNRNPGAQVLNLDFNRHSRAHLFRAGLEGVAFSFAYGMNAMRELGLDPTVIRVGNDNLFQSRIFSGAVADLTGCRIEMLRTTGAAGAAIGAGVGIGHWALAGEGLENLEIVGKYEPGLNTEAYQEAYLDWLRCLDQVVNYTP